MAILTFDDDKGAGDPVLEVLNDHGNDIFLFKKSGTEVFRLNKYGEMVSTSGWDHRVLNIPLGDIAADSDAFRYPVIISNKKITLLTAYISVDTTVAASATAYQTVALADADGNSIVSTTTAAGLTAKTPVSLGTLSITHGILNAEEACYLTFTKTLTGMALSGCVLHLEYAVDATETSAITAEEQVINSLDTNGQITSDQTVRDHLSIKNKDDGTEYFNVSLDGIVEAVNAANRFHIAINSAGAITAASDDTKVITAFRANGAVQIDKIYIGSYASEAADSDADYETIDIKKNASNKLASISVGGPVASGLALTYGVYVSMGTIEEKEALLASGDRITIHFTATSSGENLAGLFFLIVYRKLD